MNILDNILRINKLTLKQYGISWEEYFFMMVLTCRRYVNISIDCSKLLHGGFIIMTEDGYTLTPDGSNFLKEVVVVSVDKNVSLKEIEVIAIAMREIFPEGKKLGTSKYWRDNQATVMRKLNGFFKVFGHHDADKILEATRKYVDSFGDNKQLMRILPYFILKDNESDLLTVLENFDAVSKDANNDQWTSKLQ